MSPRPVQPCGPNTLRDGRPADVAFPVWGPAGDLLKKSRKAAEKEDFMEGFAARLQAEEAGYPPLASPQPSDVQEPRGSCHPHAILQRGRPSGQHQLPPDETPANGPGTSGWENGLRVTHSRREP